MELEEFKTLEQKLMENITLSITKQIDEFFIEGLRRKGIEMGARGILEMFVKMHCKAVTDEIAGETTYYVDDIPFLLHKQPSSIVPDILNNYGQINISVIYGDFYFI